MPVSLRSKRAHHGRKRRRHGRFLRHDEAECDYKAAVPGVRCAQVARPIVPLRSLSRTPPPKPPPLGSIAQHLSMCDAMEARSQVKFGSQLSPPCGRLSSNYSFVRRVSDWFSWASPRPICGTVKSHLRATCGIVFRVVSPGTLRVAPSYDSSLRWHVGCRFG